MNQSGHPTPELIAVMRRVVQHDLVDMGYGAKDLEEVVTWALKGLTSNGRRWSRLDRTVEDVLPQSIQWRGMWGDQAAHTTTLEQVLHDVLTSKIQSRTVSNLPNKHHVGGAQILGQLGIADERDVWRWLWDSPYLAVVAREV